MLVLILIAGLLAASAREASAQLVYFEGSIAWSSHFECQTGNVEFLTGQYVGYQGLSNGTYPRVDDVYYGHIVVSTVGNACAGVYVVPEITLPPNTALAISATNKVRCFSTLNNVTTEFTNQASCRQTPRTSGNTFGDYSFLDTPNGGAWPLATGSTLEITFPMQSTAPPNGNLIGFVRSIDGDGNPWTQSTKLVSVPYPSVTYPNPSFTNLTQTSVRLLATITNGNGSGTGYFDWGLNTNYGTTESVAITNQFTSWSVWDDLANLSPGTTYHWRVRYVTSGGASYTGIDQTFTTSGGSPPPGAFSKSAPTNGATGRTNPLTFTWGTSSGATSYAYCFDTSNDNACSNWLSTGASTSVQVSGLSASTTYYWHARASNAAGTTYANGSSTAFWSFTTLALPTFTDSTLQTQSTIIKAVHITELRQRVSELRSRYSLTAAFWTDSSLSGVMMKRIHLVELRIALNAVYAAAGRTLPAYTHGTITSNVTVITALDITELRAAILAIW